MTSERSWLTRVTEAAVAFESRWTLAALRRVDPELHGRLVKQRDLFDEAYVTGSASEVERQGSAMCRGWAAAVKSLGKAQEPDDAYFEGFDATTGTRVLVASQKAVATRVAPGTIFITPDEVAVLLGRRELVSDVMRQFPGATIAYVRPESEALAKFRGNV